MNYEQLVKALRWCDADFMHECDNCLYVKYKHCKDDCMDRMLRDAADAIEALQAEQKKTVTQIFGEEQMAWEGRCKDLMKYISDLQAEIRESMQTCAECGDEQEQKVKELQVRLGEAENPVERWKDMYLTKHEPKQGEWELIDGAEPMRWGCSRCKYMSWDTSNYCPRCGAKMEVQE